MLGFVSSYDYGVAAIVNGFMILKKDYQGPTDVLMPMHISLELGQLQKQFVSYEDSFPETHFVVADWVNVEGDHLFLNESYSGSAWWGPYITVPPGKYEVEVRYSSVDTSAEPIMNLTVYWFQHQTYAEETVWSNETTSGQINTATLEFELDSWSAALEIVGTSLGKANINVYSVTMQGIQ
jgi:hypothetical protein